MRTLTGQVLSEVDGKAIPGAHIKSIQSNKSAITDGDGKFTLQLTETDTEITISYLGYISQKIKLNKTKVYYY